MVFDFDGGNPHNASHGDWRAYAGNRSEASMGPSEGVSIY